MPRHLHAASADVAARQFCAWSRLLLLAATAGCWLPPVVALTTHRPARPLPFAAAARLPLIP